MIDAILIPILIAVIVFGVPVVLFLVGFYLWVCFATFIQHRDLKAEDDFDNERLLARAWRVSNLLDIVP